MLGWKKKNETTHQEAEILDRALNAWHREESRDDRLADAVHRRILMETNRLSTDETCPAPYRSLFLPSARLAMAALAPLVVLSMLVGSVLLSQRTLRHADEAAPSSVRVDAVKAGDEVIFRIRNGETKHKVSKSDIAKDFGVNRAVDVTAGQFRDRLDSGAQIVFYRID